MAPTHAACSDCHPQQCHLLIATLPQAGGRAAGQRARRPRCCHPQGLVRPAGELCVCLLFSAVAKPVGECGSADVIQGLCFAAAAVCCCELSMHWCVCGSHSCVATGWLSCLQPFQEALLMPLMPRCCCFAAAAAATAAIIYPIYHAAQPSRCRRAKSPLLHSSASLQVF